LFQTNFHNITGPGWISQLGRDRPSIERRSKSTKRSWGVAFAAVHNKDLTECRDSGRTVSYACSDTVYDSSALPFRRRDVSAMVVANVLCEKNVFLKYF